MKAKSIVIKPPKNMASMTTLHEIICGCIEILTNFLT